jgi:hypothetical protein
MVVGNETFNNGGSGDDEQVVVRNELLTMVSSEVDKHLNDGTCNDQIVVFLF